MNVNINVTKIVPIFEAIVAAGGRPVVVGGAVRAAIMREVWGVQIADKDIDVEVFGIGQDQLQEVLRQFGRADLVGASFGVVKLFMGDKDFDFSSPRRDNKVAAGNKGFDVSIDPFMSFEEAASRRDFTMNSVGWDFQTGEVLDPFNGIGDIKRRILRPTSSAFMEDPLRVLRGMQFAARFDMKVDPSVETQEMMDAVRSEFSALAKDRVWGEWEKWAARGVKPSAGLRFLKDTGWISLFPEINSLIGCWQDAEWHPEGDAFEHTCETVDAAARIADRDGVSGEDRVARVIGALAHDFGKPATTVMLNGHWRSPAHDVAGEAPTRSFMKIIGRSPEGQKSADDLTERVVKMVIHHMRHIGIVPNASSVRRIARDISIADMAAVVEADHSARPPLTGGMPANMQAIVDMAKAQAVFDAQPKPILMGRDLIDMGMKPNKQFGIILSAAFDAQIDGSFSDLDGAKAWVNSFKG